MVGASYKCPLFPIHGWKKASFCDLHMEMATWEKPDSKKNVSKQRSSNMWFFWEYGFVWDGKPVCSKSAQRKITYFPGPTAPGQTRERITPARPHSRNCDRDLTRFSKAISLMTFSFFWKSSSGRLQPAAQLGGAVGACIGKMQKYVIITETSD